MPQLYQYGNNSVHGTLSLRGASTVAIMVQLYIVNEDDSLTHIETEVSDEDGRWALPINASAYYTVIFTGGYTIDDDDISKTWFNYNPDEAGIRWRGDWENGQTYSVSDAVYYGSDSSSYICTVAHISDQNDTDPDGDGTPDGTTKWDIFAQASDVKTAQITSDDYQFAYDENGENASPASVLLTATPKNFSVPYYEFYEGAVSKQGPSTTATYSFTAPNPYVTSTLLKVEVREGIGGSVEAFDSTTIIGTKAAADGEGAIMVVLDNPTFAVATDSDGNNGSYAGSGVTVDVYEGNTQLTIHDNIPPDPGKYYISRVGNSITAGAITQVDGQTQASLAIADAITADTASITITVHYKRINGSTTETFVIKQNFSRVKAGVDGAEGAEGSAGTDARGVSLTMPDQVFTYDSEGTSLIDPVAPGTTVVTATAVNTTDTPYYKFFLNNVEKQNTISNTYSYTPPTAITGFPQWLEVELREVNGTNPILARDQISLAGIRPGSNSHTIVMGNEAHTIPTDNNGDNGDYTNSGTTIKVFEGATALIFREPATGLAGTFSVAEVGFDITPASTPTGSGGTTCTYGVASNMTGGTGTVTARIEFTITINSSEGVTTAPVRTQTFSKSIKGDQGDQGIQGADGDSGSNGINAKTVSLTGDDYQIKYDQVGNNPDPTSILFSGSEQNIVDPYYTFYVAGVEERVRSQVSTFTWDVSTEDPTIFSNKVVELEAHEGDVATVTAIDSTSIFGTRSGADTLLTFLTNEAHTFSADDVGVVADYSGGATDIYAYEGATELDTDNSVPYANSTFRLISATPDSITVGTINHLTDYIEVQAPDSMTANQASITYVIRITDKTGATTDFTKIQTFSKSLAGSGGDPGDFTRYAYIRAETIPATPTGGGSYASPTPPITGWSFDPPEANGETLWMSSAVYNYSGGPSAWSTPVQIEGANAADWNWTKSPAGTVEVIGNRFVQAVGGSVGVDKGAYTGIGYRNGIYVEWKVNQIDKNVFVGIDDIPGIDPDTMQFAFEFTRNEPTPTVQALVNGTLKGTSTTYNESTTVSILYDGEVATFYINGAVKHTEAVSNGDLFYLTSSFNETSGSYIVTDFKSVGGTGPGLTYRGEWEAATEYTYTNTKRDIVTYTVDGNDYYVAEAQKNKGLFSGQIPTNTTYWTPFSQDFSSISTGLLMTEQSLIKEVLTVGTSSKVIKLDGTSGKSDIFILDATPTPNKYLGFTSDGHADVGGGAAFYAGGEAATGEKATISFNADGKIRGSGIYVINGKDRLIEGSRLFGNGDDGAFITPIDFILNEDKYYTNYIVAAGKYLDTNGFRLFVSGTLTIKSGGIIRNSGSTGSNGSGRNAPGAGGAGGGAGTLLGGAGGAVGGNGGFGGNLADPDGIGGAAGGASNTADYGVNDTDGKTGGTGRDGNDAAGGGGGGSSEAALGGGASSQAATRIENTDPHILITMRNLFSSLPTAYPMEPSAGSSGGSGGGGGGYGNGDNGGDGGAGGGAGGAGGHILISAKNIIANEGDCYIRTNGGAGGNGADGTDNTDNGGNGGGGGGGAGGNGGIVTIVTNTLEADPIITNLNVEFTGGAAGTIGLHGSGTPTASEAGVSGTKIYVEV